MKGLQKNEYQQIKKNKQKKSPTIVFIIVIKSL